MKILHVITSLNKGGAENHLFRLAAAQAKENLNVSVIYFKGNGYWEKFLKKHKVKCKRLNLRNNFNFIQILIIFIKLLAYVKEERPKIIHAHLALPEILVLILKLLFNFKFKYVVTKHLDSFIFEGSYGQNRYFNGLLFEKLIFGFSNHVIFISKNVKKYFLSKIKVNSKKVSVIYYGIDKLYFDYKNFNNKKNYKKLKDNKNQFLILTIARHIPQKRLDLLLLGFKEFLKKNKNSRLIMVGTGPDTKKLKSLSRDLKIEHNVNWIQYSENVKELFQISNVFCLTSLYEGLGLVLLESMYLKVPVVTVKTSAMAEVIENSYEKFSLKKNFKPQELCKLLLKVKKNKTLVKLSIYKGKSEVNKKFSVKKMLNKTNQVYKSLYEVKKNSIHN